MVLWNDMYRVHSMQIDFPQKTISVALIGDYFSYDVDCAVLEESVLTVLQNGFIIQLNVNNSSIIHCKEIEHFGCNFRIYRIKNGYIIYGEIEITMLDSKIQSRFEELEYE